MDSCRRGFSPMRHKELWGMGGGEVSVSESQLFLGGSYGAYGAIVCAVVVRSCIWVPQGHLPQFKQSIVQDLHIHYHIPYFAFFSCTSIFYPITTGFTPVSGSQKSLHTTRSRISFGSLKFRLMLIVNSE